MQQVIIDLHVTYRCNIACDYCNRLSNLTSKHTPDITLEQWKDFLATCPPFRRLNLLGGEPTLHHYLQTMVYLAQQRQPDAEIYLYSNAYTQAAKAAIVRLSMMGVQIVKQTIKLNGSVDHGTRTIWVSPEDMGLPERDHGCNWAAGLGGTCGYSVDARGITACPIGGAIDGVLDLGQRTWDWSRVHAGQLRNLCRHCGVWYPWPKGTPFDTLPKIRGQTMSRTWLAALQKNDLPNK